MTKQARLPTSGAAPVFVCRKETLLLEIGEVVAPKDEVRVYGILPPIDIGPLMPIERLGVVLIPRHEPCPAGACHPLLGDGSHVAALAESQGLGWERLADGIVLGEALGSVFVIRVAADDVDILVAWVPCGVAGERIAVDASLGAPYPDEVIEPLGAEIVVHETPQGDVALGTAIAPPKPWLAANDGVACRLVERSPKDGDVGVAELGEAVGYEVEVSERDGVLPSAVRQHVGDSELRIGAEGALGGCGRLGDEPVPAYGDETTGIPPRLWDGEIVVGAVGIGGSVEVGVDVDIVETNDGWMLAESGVDEVGFGCIP